MAQRMLNHFYPTYAEAVQAVADVTAFGIPTDDISLIESDADARLPPEVMRDSAQNPAGTGATLGAAIGAGLGALAGVGAVAIPYTDPLVAAGWVVTCVTLAGVGALAGFLIGILFVARVRKDPAHATATRLQTRRAPGDGTRGRPYRAAGAAAAGAAARAAARRTPGRAGLRHGTRAGHPHRAAGAAAIHRSEREVQYRSE